VTFTWTICILKINDHCNIFEQNETIISNKPNKHTFFDQFWSKICGKRATKQGKPSQLLAETTILTNFRAISIEMNVIASEWAGPHGAKKPGGKRRRSRIKRARVYNLARLLIKNAEDHKRRLWGSVVQPWCLVVGNH